MKENKTYQNNYNDDSDHDFHTYKTVDPLMWEILKSRSRKMRKESTPAEDVFWQIVRRNNLGVSFRRQHAINHYIVDFICIRKKLIIEIDGSIHDDKVESDQERTDYLNSIGFHVIRFTNEEVVNDIESIKLALIKWLDEN